MTVSQTLLKVLLSCALLAPRVAQAQFNIPLPRVYPADQVRREDMQMLFLLEGGNYKYDDQVAALRQRVALARTTAKDSADFAAATAAFCRREQLEPALCSTALQVDSLRERFGVGMAAVCDAKGIARSGCTSERRDEILATTRERELAEGRELYQVHFKTVNPLGGVSRPRLARYMRSSGTDATFTFASQFAASVSDDVAYVVSNVVRGLTGRTIFSADYAAVVARESKGDPSAREAIESDKANLLRAINNGGTLVGRFTMPMYARSGATGALAAGLTASGGVIGPVAESEAARRKGVGAGAAEVLGTLAIRSMAGDSQQTAELLLGARAGYTRSGGALRLDGGFRDVGYLQGLIGLRQNGSMSVSALVSLPNHGFSDLVPTLVLNFAAVR